MAWRLDDYVARPAKATHVEGRFQSRNTVEVLQGSEVQSGFLLDDLHGCLDAVVNQLLRRIGLEIVKDPLRADKTAQQVLLSYLETGGGNGRGGLLNNRDLPVLNGDLVGALRPVAAVGPGVARPEYRPGEHRHALAGAVALVEQVVFQVTPDGVVERRVMRGSVREMKRIFNCPFKFVFIAP